MELLVMPFVFTATMSCILKSFLLGTTGNVDFLTVRSVQTYMIMHAIRTIIL